MDDAAHCDRLAFMRDGRIIAEGSPDDLKRETAQDTLENAFLFYTRNQGEDSV